MIFGPVGTSASKGNHRGNSLEVPRFPIFWFPVLNIMLIQYFCTSFSRSDEKTA